MPTIASSRLVQPILRRHWWRAGTEAPRWLVHSAPCIPLDDRPDTAAACQITDLLRPAARASEQILRMPPTWRPRERDPWAATTPSNARTRPQLEREATHLCQCSCALQPRGRADLGAWRTSNLMTGRIQIVAMLAIQALALLRTGQTHAKPPRTMFSGRTQASNLAPSTPIATAASLSVVPSAWAFRAMTAARS